MARNFTITTPAETVRVGPDGRGEMLFTVTNVSGIPNRGLAKLAPQGNTNSEWLTLTDVEREFPVGGVHQFRVAANIPPGTPAGRYTWRFDVVSALKRGEELDAGPTVAFEIGATEPPKKGIPWWVWLAIAIGALVLAVVLFLAFRKKDPPPPPPPPEVVKVKVPNVFGNDPTSAAIRIQNAKLRVFIEPRFIKSDPRILIKGLNTVVDQDPKADTEVDPDTNVTIFVLRLRGSRFDTDLKGLTPTTAKELQRFKRAAEKPE
jgi:hypothetical protein